MGAVLAVLAVLMAATAALPQLAKADVVTNSNHTWEWTLDSASGELKISGQVDLGTRSSGMSACEDIPWYSQRKLVKSVTFGAPVSFHGGMGFLFYGCSELGRIDGLGNVDTSEAASMAGMFYGCSKLESLDLSGFDTSQVASMASMFFDCSSLRSLDLSGLDTSRVMDMGYMLFDCSSLRSLDLSGLDTSRVMDMHFMFHGCSKLESLDLSGFDTSNVTNMIHMFSYSSSLRSLDLSGFDTSSVTRMDTMFLNCTSLKSLDLSGFDNSQLEDMYGMFYGCSSLVSLDLSGFNTSSVKFMGEMFGGCSSLVSLDLSGFNTSSVKSMNKMFNDCSSLVALMLGRGWKSPGSETELFAGWKEDRDGDGRIDSQDVQFTGAEVVARGSDGLAKLRYLKRNLNRLWVTWVVYKDPVYGMPASGASPATTSVLEFDRLPLAPAPTTSWITSNGRPSGTRGTWSFSGWSGAAYGNILIADTIVTGSWKFTPDPVKPAGPAKSSAPTAATVEKRVLAMKSDKDVAGSTFAILQARASKTAKTSVTLKWTKVKSATRYVVYGNKCGKKNRYVKLKTVKATKASFKHKKLKGKTYYKYIVVAVGSANGTEAALATSKTVHAATKGSSGKANPTKVKLNKKRLSLKRGKSSKVKASQLKKRGAKVSAHRKVAFESSDPSVATVSSKGKVTAKGKGTAHVFAYAQNGVFAKVKVTVR